MNNVLSLQTFEDNSEVSSNLISTFKCQISLK